MLVERLSDTDDCLRACPRAVSIIDTDTGRETGPAANADLKDVGIDVADLVSEISDAASPKASMSAALGANFW